MSNKARKKCSRCNKTNQEFYTNGGKKCKQCTREIRIITYYQKMGKDPQIELKRNAIKKSWLIRKRIVKLIDNQINNFEKSRQIELGLATCQRCKKEKPLSEYSKDCTNPRGIQRKCKSCHCKSVRQSIDKRLRNDKAFKYRYDICMKINNAYRKGFKKEGRTQDILGCTYEELKEWLNNVSEYKNIDSHLDHVIPVSYGINQKEINALNHYSNLQLLSPFDNRVKGNKYVKISNLSRVLQHHFNPNLIKKIVSRSGFDIV